MAWKEDLIKYHREKAADFRTKGDYQDFIYFEEDDVSDWMEKAEKYIKELEKCIDKEMIS